MSYYSNSSVNPYLTTTSYKYLIIGNGKIARHFVHYLSLLGISYKQWTRQKHEAAAATLKNEQNLKLWAEQSERILLLISDGAITEFIQTRPFLLTKKVVHFSGALSFSFAESAHPLCCFGSELYKLETYTHIPFVTELGRTAFDQLLPNLPNPHYELAAEKKALYHSLCVFGGNFSTILWQNVLDVFESELKLPKKILYPYLEQTFQNLKTSSAGALTGPLARNDQEIISRNANALSGRPEQALYLAFVNYFQSKKSKNKETGRHLEYT